MEALNETPGQNPDNSDPAEQAGIFLIGPFDLFDPRTNRVQEAISETVKLEKSGRYAGTIATPGQVTIVGRESAEQ